MKDSYGLKTRHLKEFLWEILFVRLGDGRGLGEEIGIGKLYL
jgi:hypothetical protein